ncbi:MAG: DUF58 domain-containing protein [Chloroflexi bacterium]|nr:DUF58 domain-containing protein [Chloroflexota bacterium]MCI0773831.1 DUF58 domain-containing protein [Chloroflexota bacterium]MCI0807152.1 DUF58 domain-containing protein [Chloroflexota bacterium]MCI0854551.1 DUF58 domain-containing protein [Chloroflexota bacterium]MCI0862247.1 DUF58 domain-containing protein [Chloroflexota bacterium]
MNTVQRRPAATLLLIIVLILLGLQMVGVYRGWRIVLIGFAGTLLVGRLWAARLRRGLKLEHDVQFGWFEVGDRVLSHIALTNKSRFPALWVEVNDRSTLPSASPDRGVAVSGKGQLRWLKEAICTRRGLFALGPMSLKTGDPFGLYAVRLDYPETVPFLVMPQVVPLPFIHVAAGGMASEGRIRNDAPEQSVISSSARVYEPGDALRWVHWPTTARRGELHVRRFEGAPSGDWWIVLDAELDIQAGSGDDSTLEHAVILAASLADRGLRAGRSVGLAAADQELIWLPPRGSEAHRWQIMRSLALLSYGDHGVGELLSMLQPNATRASLIIITPAVDASWIEALIPLLHRGDVPTVLLLDPKSFGGTGDSAEVISALSELGVAYYQIDRELLGNPRPRAA